MTRVRVPLRSYTGCASTGSGSGGCSSSGGGSSTTFLELTDTPDSYAGQGGLAVKVKGDESGLEFGTVVASAGLDSATVNTAGATITLDMNAQFERMFKGSVSIGGVKTWALSNDSNAIFIPSVKFTMTTTDIQTFPANFKMNSLDGNWDSGAQQWTPPDVGTYEMSASFDGTNWLMKITGPF